MSVRAIHIELAHSLSTDSANMTVKRFIARRGTPLIIHCDNGTNFKGMNKELKFAINEMDTKKINEFAIKNKIECNFNPPTASHMGGAWERLILSVKKSLDTVFRSQSHKEEVLFTTLLEIEHAINSRPLTHISVDPRDQEALTPNHFLLGSPSGEIRFGRCDAQKECSRKHWQIAQNISDTFWNRWLREDLHSLLPGKKWLRNEIPFNVGDIVLIMDDNAKRNQWRKGVVTRTFPGADSQVRTVGIRTANGH